MAIQVLKQFFDTREQVLDDIKKDGYWPTTFITPVSGELPVHWHDSEIHGYVMEGSTWIRDGESGERLTLEAGDKLIIPVGALHAEGETTTPMLYIIASPHARPLNEFLRMHKHEYVPASASGAQTEQTH